MFAIATMAGAARAQNIELISRASNGTQAADVSQAVISATGRFVLFRGQRDLAGTPGFDCDVWWLRDRELGTTEIVSRRSDGVVAQCSSVEMFVTTYRADVNSDGRFVVFDYAATNLQAGLPDQGNRVYLLDRQLSSLRLLGTPTTAAVAPSMDRVGRRILYVAGIEPSPPPGEPQAGLYIEDRETGERILLPPAILVGGESPQFALSEDGRRVVFLGRLAGSTIEQPQVYVYDIESRTTTLASVGFDGQPLTSFPTTFAAFRPAISGDGRIVAYEGEAFNLYGGIGKVIIARILDEQRNVLVSRDPSGNPAVAAFYQDSPDLSHDGRRIVFRSNAPILPGALDAVPYFPQVYVFDLLTLQVRLVSHTPEGRGSVNGSSDTDCEDFNLPGFCSNLPKLSPRISADGRFVAFHAKGPDLLLPDANGEGRDVYVRDLGPVGPAPSAPIGVPASGLWGLLALIGVLALAAMRHLARRVDDRRMRLATLKPR
jgi:Tol biopolymer transport system component